MLEKFRDSRAFRIGRNAVIATALIGAATPAFQTPVEAGGGNPYACSDHYKSLPLNQGETVTIHATGAVAEGDVTIDQQAQFDGNGDTRTLTALRSNNRSAKDWIIYVNYPGTAYIQKCGAGLANTEKLMGQRDKVLDPANNATQRVETNWMFK